MVRSLATTGMGMSKRLDARTAGCLPDLNIQTSTRSDGETVRQAETKRRPASIPLYICLSARRLMVVTPNQLHSEHATGIHPYVERLKCTERLETPDRSGASLLKTHRLDLNLPSALLGHLL